MHQWPMLLQWLYTDLNLLGFRTQYVQSKRCQRFACSWSIHDIVPHHLCLHEYLPQSKILTSFPCCKFEKYVSNIFCQNWLQPPSVFQYTVVDMIDRADLLPLNKFNPQEILFCSFWTSNWNIGWKYSRIFLNGLHSLLAFNYCSTGGRQEPAHSATTCRNGILMVSCSTSNLFTSFYPQYSEVSTQFTSYKKWFESYLLRITLTQVSQKIIWCLWLVYL